MSKNASTGNLIDAHSWVGLVVSVPLFVVFWAGSLALFRVELGTWAEAPHYEVSMGAVSTGTGRAPLQAIVEDKLQTYDLNTEEHLSVVLASDRMPYHRMYIDLRPEEGYEGPEQLADLTIDPVTGATLADEHRFEFADFLYELHVDLRLPMGVYLVGFITLFFLVLILTGVLIHARKLVRNFFAYRRNRNRTKLLDIHNVIGVITLPYALMFAITGLVFNLSLLFQIASVLLVYQGDAEQLFSDAGFYSPEQVLSGEPLDMGNAYQLIDETAVEYGSTPDYVQFFNYGDENAVVRVTGRQSDGFANRYEVYYRVVDGTVLDRQDAGNYNVLQRGINIVAALHFGSFSGLDLRFLYFVLGIGVAGMILVGNLLWVDKRSKQKNQGPKALHFVTRLTLGTMCGIILATAAGFFAERVFPEMLDARNDWVKGVFLASWAVSALIAFPITDARNYVRRTVQATAALLMVTVVCDWLLFGTTLQALWQVGDYEVFGVQAGLASTAILCLAIVANGKRAAVAAGQEHPKAHVLR